MKTCAWCKTTMKEGDPAQESHGICASCTKRYFPGLDLKEVKER